MLNASLILNVVIGLLNIGLVLITVIFERPKYRKNKDLLSNYIIIRCVSTFIPFSAFYIE